MGKTKAQIQKDYRERNPWYRHLEHARRRCNNPKQRYYKLYGGRGIKCLLTLPQVRCLYERDQAHLMDKPSLDRIDPDGHYTFDNCQFIELLENAAKSRTKKEFDEDQKRNEDQNWED